MVAMAQEPSLLALVQPHHARWQACLEAHGLPTGAATLIRMAADGLWQAELLGLAASTPELRNRVISRLLELAGGHA
ncbi:hypothetical protein [Deinobacterium chartae]|nr:hypothetical protein [Deinobacterium chartae]